jgi:hypothetical protein
VEETNPVIGFVVYRRGKVNGFIIYKRGRWPISATPPGVAELGGYPL